jgi:hypothetical protein
LASTKNPFADLKKQVKKSKETKEESTKSSFLVKEEEIEKKDNQNTTANTKHNTRTAINSDKVKADQKSSIVIFEKKSDEKVRRNFYVNKGLDKELNKLAKKTGNSKSELVDIAIEFLINNYRTK